MDYPKTRLRRVQLRARLEANPETYHSIAALAIEFGRVQARIVKYDLEWIRDNEGLDITFPERGMAVFSGVTHTKLDDNISKPGRHYALVGQCDFCDRPFMQDGHTKFCSEDCRHMFGLMDFEQRRNHTALKLGFLLTDNKETPIANLSPMSDPRVRAAVEKDMAGLRATPTVEPTGDQSHLEGDLDPIENQRDLVSDLDIVER